MPCLKARFKKKVRQSESKREKKNTLTALQVMRTIEFPPAVGLPDRMKHARTLQLLLIESSDGSCWLVELVYDHKLYALD